MGHAVVVHNAADKLHPENMFADETPRSPQLIVIDAGFVDDGHVAASGTPAHLTIPPASCNLGRVLVAGTLDGVLEIAKQALNDAALVPPRDNLLGHLLAQLGPHLLALQHLVWLKEALTFECALDPVAQADAPVHEAVGGLGVAVAGLANVELFGLGRDDVTSNI